MLIKRDFKIKDIFISLKKKKEKKKTYTRKLVPINAFEGGWFEVLLLLANIDILIIEILLNSRG